MLKLIIFDWDGTLANSIPSIVRCKQWLAEKYQLPIPSSEIIKSVLGKNFEEAIRICFPNITDDLLEIFCKDFREAIKQEEFQASLFSGVKKTLIQLKNSGFYLAIATAKSRTELNSALLYNQLNNFFDITCCGDEFPSKPNPAMLLFMTEKLNLNSSECLMIGDSPYDILCAKNAGVFSVAITWGANDLEQLQKLHPDICIADIRELYKIIAELTFSRIMII